uniref:Cytochrome-b5 reductase n=1 Tax=Angiostrongylus cantonensis TaxID=6313 RepID=A0A0K0DEE6_ANGCA
LFKNLVGKRTEYGRFKVELPRGRSLVDWIRLASGKILAKKNMSVDHVELVKHNKREDCWVHLFGQVYDVTSYLEFHPGGIPELMRAAGNDSTGLFNHYHPWVNYERMLKSCLVGRFTGDLSMCDVVTGEKSVTLSCEDWNASDLALENILVDLSQSEKHFRIVVQEKRPVSHHTLLFTLRLPEGLFFPVAPGRHVSVKIHKGGSRCVPYYHFPYFCLGSTLYRFYTPEGNGWCNGSATISLMIKIYSDGICTPCLGNLAVGDSIEVSEPIGKTDLSRWISPECDLVLLAAGTGITPMVNVLISRLRKMEMNPCNTRLLLFNKTEQDIVSDDWLPIKWDDNTVKVEHILTSPSEGWNGRRGHIDADMIPPVHTSMRVLVCGPDEFNQNATK